MGTEVKVVGVSSIPVGTGLLTGWLMEMAMLGNRADLTRNSVDSY
jgi:hypothetical protein